MLGGAAIPTTMCVLSPNPPKKLNLVSRNCFPGDCQNPALSGFYKNRSSSLSATFPSYHISLHKQNERHTHFSPRSASSSSSELTEEPATNVKFQTSLSFPGCSSSLALLGTGSPKIIAAIGLTALNCNNFCGPQMTSGYREKVFAIIGVKVYAAGFYVDKSLLSDLSTWKGQSASEIQENSSLFNTIFKASLEKSLQIVLVRDVDGKTFWDALDEAISPRIKVPTPIDDSALSTFRGIFQGRSLKKGTAIILTWPDPSKMLVSVSSNGLPSNVDATIESTNVSSALFDVFLGDAPVSPSLKASVANGLATSLK